MAAVTFTCLALIFGLGCIRLGTQATSSPSYCSYDASENNFICDYSMMSDPAFRPIDFTQFDPQPQRMTLYVNGYLPYLGDTQVFSEEFGNINIGDFDTSYPAELTIDCKWYGSIYFQAGAFANMSHLHHLTIRNCYTYNIPAETFKELDTLDFLSFEGGAIDWVDADAMASLSVEKMDSDAHTFPQTKGHFEIRNCKFNTKNVPPGLLFNWKNLTSVTLRNADLNTVSADTFRYTTKLKYIDLSNNLFTNIPVGLFDGLDSLAEVHFYSINWYCSCNNLWWYTYLRDRNITIFGELMCETPSGTSIGKYWNEVCVEIDLCEGQIGVEWKEKNTCVTLFGFLRYGFSMFSLFLMVPALALTIQAKRQAPAGGGRPKPGGRATNAPAVPNKKSRRVSDIDIEKGNGGDDRKRRHEHRRHRDKNDYSRERDRDRRDRDGDGRRDKDRDDGRRRDKDRERRRRKDNDIEDDLYLPD